MALMILKTVVSKNELNNFCIFLQFLSICNLVSFITDHKLYYWRREQVKVYKSIFSRNRNEFTGLDRPFSQKEINFDFCLYIRFFF